MSETTAGLSRDPLCCGGFRYHVTVRLKLYIRLAVISLQLPQLSVGFLQPMWISLRVLFVLFLANTVQHTPLREMKNMIIVNLL